MNGHFKGYLARAGGVAGFAILATLVVNAIFDPYRILGTPTYAGLSVVKPRAHQHRTESKRFQVERIAPRTLILGNSRAEVGFDPGSSAWPASARPVYNGAIPGSSIVSARDELANVLRTHRPGRMLLGAEFLDFLVDARAPGEPPAARIFGRWDRMRAKVSSLVSLDALLDSLRTLNAQYDPYAPDLTVLGFNPMREYVGFAEAEGYFGLFRQRYLDSRRTFSRLPRTIRNEHGASPGFAALEEILRTARQHKLHVDIVTYPYHATQVLLFEDVGLWTAFEEWKAELASVASRYAEVALWDFAVFDDYTRQALPAYDVHPGVSPWYWEPSHFKRELGDRILLGILSCSDGKVCAGRMPVPGPELEAHLARQRRLRDEYRLETQASAAYRRLTSTPGSRQ